MMKKCIFKRKIPLWLCLFLLVSIPIDNQAQSVERQCISSYGANVTSENVIFNQTAGQPYNTTASYIKELSLLHGFQQPVMFKVAPINSTLISNKSQHVYPNPAVYSVTLESEEVIEDALIHIYDINGKLIFSKQASQFVKCNINCEDWQNGNYLITIRDKNKNRSTLILTINK